MFYTLFQLVFGSTPFQSAQNQTKLQVSQTVVSVIINQQVYFNIYNVINTILPFLFTCDVNHGMQVKTRMQLNPSQQLNEQTRGILQVYIACYKFMKIFSLNGFQLCLHANFIQDELFSIKMQSPCLIYAQCDSAWPELRWENMTLWSAWLKADVPLYLPPAIFYSTWINWTWADFEAKVMMSSE